jgi:hypothetical protein
MDRYNRRDLPTGTSTMAALRAEVCIPPHL